MRFFAFVVSAVLVALASAPPAAAQRPFDPRAYQRQHVGEPTEILVLGSLHLSQTPDGFDPQVLEPLLARLAAFRPDAIAIEALPGRSVIQLSQYHPAEDVAPYVGRALRMAALVRHGAIDMDMPRAEAEVRRTLADWPASPTPAQRRRLAALFGAAGEPCSALVQWWRLDPAERIADENVPQGLVDAFAAFGGSAHRNENSLIASRLAARIGLERIHPMNEMNEDISEEFLTDYMAFWSEYTAAFDADPRSAPIREAKNNLGSPAEALATYRWLNARATSHLFADLQWLTMLNRATANEVGRRRVATWEARNLRMAGNIRDISANAPGGRVLVIVGAAHKPWLDAYLGMMSDVRIVDATAVLR